MKKIATLLLITIFLQACEQTKKEYLESNQFDLNTPNFKFPQKEFKIIGFGAYHGSAKTEDSELLLLDALTKSKSIKYYLPEIDYSLAHYFNKYLKTGDTLLLRDLVEVSGIRVTQERTIEVYEKWKKLKQLNDKLPDEEKLTILGIDYQVNYKYASMHIIELVNDDKAALKYIQDIKSMIEIDTTSYVLGDLSFAYKKLKDLVDDYSANKTKYLSSINDFVAFEHIIKNLKTTFSSPKPEREEVIYNNYLALNKTYDFKNNPQFLRMGFSHIMKTREGDKGYNYFFTRLIENDIYKKEEVISIVGYLTNSEVVWDELYDDNGNYTGFTKEAGYGIGDYEKEYFRGIQNLKDTKISDKTLYKLNNNNTPFADNNPDLIEVIMTEEKSNGEAVKGQSTTDFLDYALLISDSKASRPIYEKD